jgi:hypothetical protein
MPTRRHSSFVRNFVRKSGRQLLEPLPPILKFSLKICSNALSISASWANSSFSIFFVFSDKISSKFGLLSIRQFGLKSILKVGLFLIDLTIQTKFGVTSSRDSDKNDSNKNDSNLNSLKNKTK